MSERPSSTRENLLGLDRRALEEWFAARGERPFRARQLLPWVHRRGLDDFAPMTDLGKALRARLAAEAELSAPLVEAEQRSADGTRKWLLRLADGNAIETVLIPDGERRTLCVSSQVGCALNCRFCATARQGFGRNLTRHEIAGQVWAVTRRLRAEALAAGDAALAARPLTNVVLMGMGEPLLNLEEVLPVLRLLVDDLAYGLSRRRVTVSTAGVVPAIERLAAGCDVALAVSLHAPDDALRDELVPLNRKYPVGELLEACRRYAAGAPQRSVTFEYVLLDGVNDSPAQARLLARRLEGIRCKVNLIPFNPFPGAPFRRPPAERVDAFREVLLRAGLRTITRRPRGDDIDAACGQLVGRVRDRTRRSRRLAEEAQA